MTGTFLPFPQVEYLKSEQLMIALAGKQRQMRLIPVKALDQPDTEWIKVGSGFCCFVVLLFCVICLLFIVYCFLFVQGGRHQGLHRLRHRSHAAERRRQRFGRHERHREAIQWTFWTLGNLWGD